MKTYEERMGAILQKARGKRRRNRLIALAATAVVMTAVLLVLFVPYSTTPPSVARYAESPYYGIIQQINAYNYRPPRYKNNFETLMAQADRLISAELLAPGKDAPMDNDNSGAAPELSEPAGSYVEVTDNQVAGVIEADVFKRSDRYLYHLYGGNLNIYAIEGEDSRRIASHSVFAFLPETAWFNEPEMYLSRDCKTLTLVMRAYSKTEENATVLLNLDVSDPEKLRLSGRMLLVGNYISSRMVDGDLLVFYASGFGSRVDYEDPATYVPRYGWFDDLTCIPGEDILVPDSMTSSGYTVACILDGSSLQMRSCKAMLSGSNDAYVSRETIYFTNSFWKVTEETGDTTTRRLFSRITGVSFADGTLQETGSILVEGSVRNQYSMDALDGMLRIVTSTSFDRVVRKYGSGNVLTDTGWRQGAKSVNLYCVDLEAWSVVGTVEGFAPLGEEATSVRFDGTTAYVCTAEVIQLTDPVFFFDLSDPENITWTDTGTISGYSSSLVNFGENTLLGIGYDEERNLKVEVYRQAASQVVSVDCFTLACAFSESYKEYYIDRENGYAGLAVYNYATGQVQYLLLHFDGFHLTVAEMIPVEGHYVGTRADIIDGYLYILAETLTVVKMG